MLVMSGQALEFYRDMVLDPNSLSERQFLDNLYYNYTRFSIRRIDIAINDFNGAEIGRASCRERV